MDTLWFLLSASVGDRGVTTGFDTNTKLQHTPTEATSNMMYVIGRAMVSQSLGSMGVTLRSTDTRELGGLPSIFNTIHTMSC